MSTHAIANPTLAEATLAPTSMWRKIPLGAVVVGLAFIALAFVFGDSKMESPEGPVASHTQFFYSYITSFMFWLSIALGSLFFVLIHHGTRAGWSTIVRRIAENWMMTLVVLAVLVVPVMLGIRDTYEWSHRLDGQDMMLDRKAPYLDVTFFIIRGIVCFACWVGFAVAMYRWSTRQDVTGDIQLTHKMRRWAPLGFILFAITLTIGSIDWMMTLQPHWYSTIFGVYYFAGCLMVSGAVFALSSMALQKSGKLEKEISIEHLHDLGKWSFAFLVFWSYIAVAQLLLIWYANIPEETVFYHNRVEGGWDKVSVVLALFHFVIPFWFMMSRHIKRRKVTLAISAIILIAAQYIDMFWLVQPNLAPMLAPAEGAEAVHHASHFAVHLSDLFAFLGIGGVVVGAYAWFTTRSAVAAVRDPRMAESLGFENQ